MTFQHNLKNHSWRGKEKWKMRGKSLYAQQWSTFSGVLMGRSRNSVVSGVVASVFVVVFVFVRWTDISIITGGSFQNDIFLFRRSQIPSYPIPECSLTCPENISSPHISLKPSKKICPQYFRWIYEDLKPWNDTGITKEMVESAKKVAHMRLVILDGKLHIETYKPAFQTRDVYTIWGILQLLKLYPGKIPDVDLMFQYGDKPVIFKNDYIGPNATISLPPSFHYCGDDSSLDIVFPDWSFWGWPELNIKPWEELKKELQEGNDKSKWIERKPNAYWKGNTKVGKSRQELMKCNEGKWNAEIYPLNWTQMKQEGFKDTDLASQCTHRYKIYVEGVAWSVSEKYILACDSVSLLISPRYYDFFTRSLLPTVHYWPINDKNKCKSIKFAVEWGNNHTHEAQEIGKAGSKFIQEELQMKYVYDYMFHLLQAYAKLLRYKPKVPDEGGWLEVCPETLICGKGLKKKYKLHSMVKNPADIGPCNMPPPYKPKQIEDFLKRKENLRKKVESWEEGKNN